MHICFMLCMHACMHMCYMHVMRMISYIQLLIAILLCAYLAKHYILNLESVCYNQ